MRSRICAISISMACGRAGRVRFGNSRLLICPAICCLPFSPTGCRPTSWAILIPPTARLLRQIAAAGGTSEAARRTEAQTRHDAQAYRVMVVDDGFALNGKTYDSLSKVAFAITGTNWNGPRFFGLRDKISPEARS